MNEIRLINICEKCGSYNDWLETPDGNSWFICRRCGSTQPLVEEIDFKTFLKNKGEKNEN